MPMKRKQALKDSLLRNEPHTFGKLSKFVTENVPERFFSKDKDDAKPDYHIGLVGSKDAFKEFAKEYGSECAIEANLDGETIGQKYLVRNPTTIKEVERVNRDDLKQTLRKIYEARSGLIHRGVRLPRGIVFGLFRGVPTEAVVEVPENREGKSPMEIPPLLTFERLVSYSMVEFLRKQGSKMGQ